MKNIFILTYLLLTVLFFEACQAKDNLESLKLFKQLAAVKNKDDIYIIPGSGCTGCISDIESFAITNIHSPKKYFLFTTIKSFKLFKNRFGIDFINNQNVILDTLNLFKYPKGYSELYPVLLSKVNGTINVKHSFKP